MKIFWINIIRVFLVGSLFLLGCADQRPDAQEKIDGSKRKAFHCCNYNANKDIVSQLLGDSCRIYSLMGPGVDPHLYKPTARDMTNITSADLVIYHGLKLEGKLASTIEKATNNKIIAYAVSSTIPKDKLLASDDKASPYPDPLSGSTLRFGPNACTDWQICYLRSSDSKNQIRKGAQLETEYRQISKMGTHENSKPSRQRQKTDH